MSDSDSPAARGPGGWLMGLRLIAVNHDVALKVANDLVDAGLATRDEVVGLPVVITACCPPDAAFLVGKEFDRYVR